MKGQENQNGSHILQLENAISSGDVKTAQSIVAILAKQKTQIKIELLPKDPVDNEYYIKIYIEDRVSSAPPLSMRIHSKTTARELKRMIFLKYNFPVQVQRLIVSQKIPKDKDILSKIGVKEGSGVFIYLVPAHTVNLTKEQFDKDRNEAHLQNITPAYSSHRESPPTIESPQIPSDFGISSELQYLNPLYAPQAMEYQPPLSQPPQSATVLTEVTAAAAPLPTNDDKVGWKCPKCTYINLPMRPGCEMCTDPRPTEYKVPESYVMSVMERDWKEKEEAANQAEEEQQQRQLQQQQQQQQLQHQQLQQQQQQQQHHQQQQPQESLLSGFEFMSP